MIKSSLKFFLFNSLLILIIFCLDRFSKLYIINLFQEENLADIYINSFLNLYLIWNKGIAFGFLSFEDSFIYNCITILICFITFVILIIIIKSNNYKVYFFIMIFGGSLGNLFDRIYYYGVPDFIDLHFNNFHWFIFNVADIFISIGVICLIYAEIFFNKQVNEK